jgi:MFS transporter, FHS family, glucose/mannose:H+ symporter
MTTPSFNRTDQTEPTQTMPASDRTASDPPAFGPGLDKRSSNALTLTSYALFLPVGIVTVLLGPLLPTLSARWSLDYSQAGALFTAQYLASTAAVAVSGVLVSRWGYRFAMKAGLLLVTVGLAFLLSGSKVLGIACIAGYGAGLGLAVPAANLLVAEVNPARRSAKLNVLNFCWSVGSVACPFLVAFAAIRHRVPLLLGLVAGCMLVVLAGITLMPSSVVEPAVTRGGKGFGIDWRHPALLPLGALFFVYVGTENGFGGWIASYAKSLGRMPSAMAVVTPSFFYAALMLGRLLAPLVLRRIDEIRLAQSGLLIAFVGMGGLLLSHALPGVAVSATLAGLGLSGVYPITIALLSREFGAAASRIGSVMFTLANLGGGSMPWLVGVLSSQFGTLKVGLAVPLVGSAAMFALYRRNWKAQFHV